MLDETAATDEGPLEFSAPTVFVVDDDRGLCEALSYLLESVHLRARPIPARWTSSLLRAGPPWLPGGRRSHAGNERPRVPEKSSRPGGCTLPIIMITGYADVSMAVRAMKAGAIEFLEKPFGDQVILETHPAGDRARPRDAALRGRNAPAFARATHS